MRVSRVEGSVRTRGGIGTNAKRKRKGKDKRIMGIEQVHDTQSAIPILFCFTPQ